MMEEPAVARHHSGLVLAVRTMPDHPVASAHLWLEAGAADETPEQIGAAHFLEHMLFKGTDRRGVGEAAAAIEGAGGDLNAFTTWDETCFNATLGAADWPLALDVLTDMLRRSLLDPAEFDREKQVVLEEIRGYQDDPDSVAAERVQAMMFGEHPYGRPIIGFPTTVEALTRDGLHTFWQHHYHPARTILAVAGPVTLPEVLAAIDPLVAGWQPGAARARIDLPAPVHQQQVERLNKNFESAVVHLSWPGPAVGHEDLPAIDVLMAALGQGAASALVVALELERGVASHTFADANAWISAGALGIGFQCGETETALQVALETVADAVRVGLAGPLVARARDGILADTLFAAEGAEAVAADLAWNVARRGDPLADRAYIARIAAVTPAQVRAVAAKYLSLDRLSAVVIDHTLTRRKVVAAVSRAVKHSTRAVAPSEGLAVRTIGGVRLATLPDKGEIAAIHVVGLGGQLAEGPRHAGIGEAWARLVQRGAGPHDATAFAERSDALGAVIEAWSGRSAFSVSATFPAANLAEVVALLGDLLVEPALTADDWDIVREEMLDDLAAQGDRPNAVASDALWRALWPDRPWRNPVLGTPSGLRAVGVRALRRLHTTQLAADNLSVAVAGGIDPDQVARLLAPILEALPRTSDQSPIEPEAAPASVHRSGPAITLRAGREQALILSGVRGAHSRDPRRFALTAATHLLDSQAGELFLELRERRGLAYGVWAQSETTMAGGVLSAGLATNPARAEEAIEALHTSLGRFIEAGPTETALERVRRMLHGLAAMRHQRVAARASDLAWGTHIGEPFGLPALKERLAALTPKEVRDTLASFGWHDPSSENGAVQIVVLPRV